MLTKQTFQRMAAIVRNIAAGEWTDELPDWAGPVTYVRHTETYPRVRAIQTAEAFLILIAQDGNPRFDRQRFLVACGLVSAPAKPAKRRPEYQPKTGEPCTCRRGVQRDNCPACEGTGQRIDFAKIRQT